MNSFCFSYENIFSPNPSREMSNVGTKPLIVNKKPYYGVGEVDWLDWFANYFVHVIFGLQSLLATGFATLGALELWGFSVIVCVDQLNVVASVPVGSLCMTRGKSWSYAAFWIPLSMIIATDSTPFNNCGKTSRNPFRMKCKWKRTDVKEMSMMKLIF